MASVRFAPPAGQQPFRLIVLERGNVAKLYFANANRITVDEADAGMLEAKGWERRHKAADDILEALEDLRRRLATSQ